MKTIICQHCTETFAGETKTAVQLAMLPHYKQAHPEVMSGLSARDKKSWMDEFDRQWEAA
jgi:hypothetical protein